MEITYSVGARVPGGGIGNLAAKAIKGISQKNSLKKLILIKNEANLPTQLIKEFSFLEKIPNYYLKDLIFDFLSSFEVEKCDVFHGWNNMCLRSLVKAKKLGVRTVVERASSFILTQSELLKEEYSKFNISYEPVDKKTIQRCLKEYEEADFIFVPSQFVLESFIKNGYSEKKIKMIPFGVDLEKFKPNEDKKITKFRVIFVGQVGLRKGVAYLLKAWKELSLEDAELLIVGPVFPDFKKVYEEYKDLSNTTFINYSKETEKLYGDSSVFVFPTIEEGTALAVLDAMAAGLPVITTPNAGSPVRDGEDGFIIPIRNVESLKEKILYFYNNFNQTLKMGKNARKQIENFSWERYQKELIKTYGQIA